MERRLNLDIAGAVSELETLLKKVFPKNIMYQIVLGKGLEFDGYREYTNNDNSEDIDWKASVRARRPLVRKYIEERDLKFMFLIDISDDMVFGSTEKLKCEYSAELCAALSHLMLTTGDRVGFALYNDNVVKFRNPALGNRQFDIFVYELSDPFNYGGNSDLNEILGNLIQTLDKSISMIFVISDFVKVNESYWKNFEILGGLFETVAIIVRDPLDKSLPDLNKEIVIENSETGEKMIVNPKVARNLYEKNSLEQLELTKKIFRDCNIDFLEMYTDKNFLEKVVEFLKERIREGRKVKLKNVY